MPEREHPQMKGMEASVADEPADEVAVHAQGENLRAGDDPVLASGDPREHLARWCGSDSHVLLNPPHLNHASDFGRLGMTAQCQSVTKAHGRLAKA